MKGKRTNAEIGKMLEWEPIAVTIRVTHDRTSVTSVDTQNLDSKNAFSDKLLVLRKTWPRRQTIGHVHCPDRPEKMYMK